MMEGYQNPDVNLMNADEEPKYKLPQMDDNPISFENKTRYYIN